jgi:ribosome maturation factor RimP
MDPLTNQLSALITPSLTAMGYELVRVRYQGGPGRATLQIMLDRQDETPLTLTDCEQVSHHLSALLDVEDPIEGAYNLEVSSAGLDRPLTRLKDFVRWRGFMAKLETIHPIGGRRRFKGLLEGTCQEDGQDWVCLTLDGEPSLASSVTKIAYNQVAQAKLILDDKLLAWGEVEGEKLAAKRAQEDGQEDGQEGVQDNKSGQENL